MSPVATLDVTRAASLWYPVMLAAETRKISEAKAAELLGVELEEYRRVRRQAIIAILELIEDSPSPIISLPKVIKDKPKILTTNRK